LYCEKDEKYNLLNYNGNISFENNWGLNNKKDFEESTSFFLFLENKKIEFQFI
jgi:hypothetical protein